jgi:hypothetical protein
MQQKKLSVANARSLLVRLPPLWRNAYHFVGGSLHTPAYTSFAHFCSTVYLVNCHSLCKNQETSPTVDSIFAMTCLVELHI